jgi:hypothetical protein
MSRWNAVPGCPSGSVQAALLGLSPLPHGWLSHAVPAGVGRSREQAVSSLGFPVPSGRARLRRSGPSRPGTDRPAGHGKAYAGIERSATRVMVTYGPRPWSTPSSRVDVLGKSRRDSVRSAGLAAGCRAGRSPRLPVSSDRPSWEPRRYASTDGGSGVGGQRGWEHT